MNDEQLLRSLAGKVPAAKNGARAGLERQEGPFGGAGDPDDLFYEFQSALVASSKAEPAPPATMMIWDLNFFMAAASKRRGAVKSVTGPGASVMLSGAGADVVKPLDLVRSVYMCIYQIAHNRAIRPCHPSHSMLLTLVLSMESNDSCYENL